jgi:hypothetical protein
MSCGSTTPTRQPRSRRLFAVTAGNVGFAQVRLRHDRVRLGDDAGKPTIKVLGSCAKNVSLYTSDTAGSLDDSTLSTSHNLIQGVVLLTTIGTASATTGVAIARSRPRASSAPKSTFTNHRRASRWMGKSRLATPERTGQA